MARRMDKRKCIGFNIKWSKWVRSIDFLESVGSAESQTVPTTKGLSINTKGLS